MARPLKPQTPFAERLVQARGEMSRADAISKLAMAPSTFGSYERGAAEPGITTIVSMADLYQVSLDWLMRGEGDMRLPTTPVPEPEDASAPVQTRRPFMRPTRRIADAPAPPPLDLERLKATLVGFAHAARQEPGILEMPSTELLEFFMKGYEWLGSASAGDHARMAAKAKAQTDREVG